MSKPAPRTAAPGAKKAPVRAPPSKPPVKPPAPRAPTKAPPKPSTASKVPQGGPRTVAKTPSIGVPKGQAPKASAARQSAPKPQQSQGPKAENWINRTVQSSVAGVGNYIGGYINSIGSGVNKVGDGIGQTITNTTRSWGQGVAGYGNTIKDQVGVGGPRVATAGNPLGMSGVGSAGAAPPAPKSKSGGGASFF